MNYCPACGHRQPGHYAICPTDPETNEDPVLIGYDEYGFAVYAEDIP